MGEIRSTVPAGAGDGRRDGEWGHVKIRETTDKQKEEQKMRFEEL